MESLEKPVKLYNALAKGDVTINKGALLIGDLSARLQDIISCDIIPSMAEVSQVRTIPSTGNTLVAGETYYIQLNVAQTRTQGWERTTIRVKAVAPADVSNQANAKAALYSALKDRINENKSLNVVATLPSVDLVLTDKAGYWEQFRKGSSTISVPTNKSGVGFTTLAATTEAVYSAGIGTSLLKKSPGIDPMIGNAYKGTIGADALKNAVSGSTYYTIILESMVGGNGVGMESEHRVLKRYNQIFFIKEDADGIDLALQVFAEAQLHKYTKDTPSMAFSGLFRAQTSGINGGPAIETDAGSNQVKIGESEFFSTNIGAAASVANAEVKNDLGIGFGLTSAETNAKGRELNTGIDTDAAGFIVGKGAFSISVRAVIATVSAGAIVIGFRKKEAVNANIAAYTDIAAIGNSGGGVDVDVVGRINSTTVNSINSGEDIADGVTFEMSIEVGSDGIPHAYFGGKKFIVAAASAQMVFDAGDELVGFCHHVNIGGATSTPVVKQLICVPHVINSKRGVILAG